MDVVRVTRSGRTYKTPKHNDHVVSPVKNTEQNCRKRLDKMWDTSKFDDLIIEEIKKQLSPQKSYKKPLLSTITSSPVKTPKKTAVSVLPSLASPLRCLSLNSPNKINTKPCKDNLPSTNTVLSPKKKCYISSSISKPDALLPRPSHVSSGENLSPNKQQQFSPSKAVKTSPKRYINYPLVASPSKKRRQESEITVTPIKSRGFYSPCKVTDTPPRSPLRSPLKSSSSNLPTSARKNIILNSPVKCGTKPPNNTPVVPPTSLPPPVKTPVVDNAAEKQVYNKVIHALHNSSPNQLIGRDEEINQVKQFITSHIDSNTAASLYISGAPGTGKTACVTSILNDKSITSRLQHVITVNCMAMTSATSIYQRIASDIGIKKSKLKNAKSSLKHIEKNLTNDGPMILMFLDEMDQLDNTHQEVLYTIFGWTSLINSRLVLIGIANSLDLTDRILPRLQSNLSCKPTVKHFKPYTKEQLARILNARISNVDSGNEVIDSTAIQFCARKVAAMTGDARKALDICRRSVEIHNTPIKQSPAQTQTPKSSGSTKVGVRQVSSVISEVYQSAILTKSRDDDNDDDSFPLQQKLLVCSLVLLNRRTKSKEGIFGKLYETYCEVCKGRQVPCIGQSELFSLCGLIEARGILSVKKAKQLRLTKIKLNVDEKDVEYALKGKALLSSILQST